MDYKEALEAYGYKLVTWPEFANADLPEGLMERALVWEPVETDFVVYDPEDDASGWFLLSWNKEAIARETCNYIIGSEPEHGPLGVDKAAMTMVEAG